MENKELTNFEVADGLASHIEEPCGALIDGKEIDLRGHYMREANNSWPIFKDPPAVSYLRYMIGEYS